jgi:hypothetical protein
MFLLDTMVISENFKRYSFPAVIDWLRARTPETIFVSVITFGEIAAGLEKQRMTDTDAFGRLAAWLDETRRDYAARTIQINTDVAVRWGRLYTQLKRRDTDLLLAATALAFDLTLVTRNVRHFEPTGVRLFNPYE